MPLPFPSNTNNGGKNGKKRPCILVVRLLMAVCLLCVCGQMAKVSIVGTWKSQKTILGVITETTYMFREDGTGYRKGVLETDFTYELDGDQLRLTFEVLSIKTVEEYASDFEGDVLTLVGENDTIQLERSA